MPSTAISAEGIQFSGCPCVCVSVCDHICQHDTLTTTPGNVTKFTIPVQLGTKMNGLNFEVEEVKDHLFKKASCWRRLAV